MQNLSYSAHDIAQGRFQFSFLNTKILCVADTKAMKRNLQKKMELYSLKHYGVCMLFFVKQAPNSLVCQGFHFQQ